MAVAAVARGAVLGAPAGWYWGLRGQDPGPGPGQRGTVSGAGVPLRTPRFPHESHVLRTSKIHRNGNGTFL